MPQYIFEARNKDGNLVRDTITAENLRMATQKLLSLSYVVLNIQEKKEQKAPKSLMGLLKGFFKS